MAYECKLVASKDFISRNSLPAFKSHEEKNDNSTLDSGRKILAGSRVRVRLGFRTKTKNDSRRIVPGLTIVHARFSYVHSFVRSHRKFTSALNRSASRSGRYGKTHYVNIRNSASVRRTRKMCVSHFRKIKYNPRLNSGLQAVTI